MKYKLNKIAKKGIALGLTALMLFSVGKKLSTPKKTPDTTNNTTISTTITNDYIDTIKSNELTVYDEEETKMQIKLDATEHINFINTLNDYNYDFTWSKYYELEEALNLYNTIKINKSNLSTLLDSSNKIDLQKLISQVKRNNTEYANNKNTNNYFYTDMNSSDIYMICETITKVVNSKFNNIEIDKIANTLMNLKMFQNKGTINNAYITNELVFVYNPIMSEGYATMQQIQGTSENSSETLESIITHEIMHLLQNRSNDNNPENGLETGFCRKYNIPQSKKTVKVDSLWNSWVLEAAAELGMSEYLNIIPGTYAKKISYIKSYNLSRFNELDLKNQNLEDAAFLPTIEEVFELLEIDTPDQQIEFLKFLYSVELTRSEGNDFWDNYTELTGITITETEKTGIKMDIRTEAIKYLTKNFYSNLNNAIYEKKVCDLETVFYLIRNWELDIYNHLEYTKTNSLPHAQEFILWHDQVQKELFSALAKSNSLTTENIITEYNEYNLQISEENNVYENCNLNNYNDYTRNYIISAKNKYSTRNFTRNNDVANYIKNTKLNTETTVVQKKH